MFKNRKGWFTISSLIVLVAGILYLTGIEVDRKTEIQSYELDASRLLEESEKEDKQKMKRAREEYFFRLLRNPFTNSIPSNIRRLELDHAQNLPKRIEGGGFGNYRTSQKASTALTSHYSWTNAGPVDVGGRTRALGIDSRNPNIVIAGGVSGGMWKSIDGGDTWEMKSDLNQNMSVTDVVQDPTAPDTWYYASGEFRGQSAADRGGTAFYQGTGIFKSTDNGETWSRLAATEDIDTSFDSPYDYVNRLVVNPVTGSLFIASNGFGIYKSTDDGVSFSSSPVLGVGGEQVYCTIEVASDGTLYAALSENSFTGTRSYTPGIYISTDDGVNWTNVTPASFPSTHQRTVLGVAPSDSKIFYSYTQKGAGDNSNQGISFHKFTLNSTGDDTASTEDRSMNLPDFGEPVGGVNTQANYNMILAVKPDDPDLVLLGATNLFRSFDGFDTAPGGNSTTVKNDFWIGGYANVNNVSQYENQHPDQHALVFDPTDPNRMWAGHDGGLSVTDDITESPVSWQDRDNGYVTSQFYTVSAPEDSASGLIIGGTQDNGTPFFNVDDQDVQSTETVDASSGDGSYAAFSKDDSLMFTSSQLGRVIRFDLINDVYTGSALVHPIDAENELFIHPYKVDGTTMYYPDVSSATGKPRIWVNNTVDAISNTNGNGTSQGWADIELSDIPSGYLISTLEVSKNPQDILYYGASSTSGGAPQIYKAEQASSAFTVTDISIPAATSGAYVHDIAVNPVNADELVAVFSNYGIAGIYHTSDGGSIWTEIEGNLEGDNTTPGPSIRSAAIIPTGAATHYIVGTSTGLYSTETLNGTSTTWMQESSASLGNSVVEYLHVRFADAAVFAGTHGRGVFKGRFQGVLTSPGPPVSPQGLQISATEDEVNLSWAANTERDITGYNIYKGNQPRSLTLLGSSRVNSFSESNSDFRPFYYSVTATDSEGNESVLSRPVAAFRDYRDIDTEWRLLGSPLTSANDLIVPETAQIVAFNGVYEPASELQQATGYWVKNSQADSIIFSGSAPTEATLTLNQGWNLISGVSDTVLVENIIDMNGTLGATPIKSFVSGAYQDATQINPGEGYFAFAQQDGQIMLQADTSAAATTQMPSQRAKEIATESFDKLIFKSGDNRSQILYISQSPLGSTRRQYFRMPPVAPGKVLDVRTDRGFNIADNPGTRIRLSSPDYPVQVTLLRGKAAGVEQEEKETSYRLIATDGADKVYMDISPEEPVLLQKDYESLVLEGLGGEEIPLTNALFPNYPNPFNPTTTIRYQISSQVQVTLEMYNLLGRKVGTYVNQVQQPGIYTISLNGANLSSGTYFMRIKAGEFSQIQKMTLIK